MRQPQTRNWSPEIQLNTNTARLARAKSGRTAELRPGSYEAAILVGLGPLHRHQDRPTPFATDPDTLDEPQGDHDDRRPHADLVIGRYQADRDSCRAGYHQGGDQCGLAADSVAVVTEDCRADRTGDKADVENYVSLQRPHQRIRIRKKQLCKDQPSDGAVEQEIIPFDRGSDRAGDQGSPQLPAVLCVGYRLSGLAVSCHVTILPYDALCICLFADCVTSHKPRSSATEGSVAQMGRDRFEKL